MVGLIVPWNFPLDISSWKLGPALACGNTVVLKPAELTHSRHCGSRARARRGIPEGVVNVVAGKGSVVGRAWSTFPTWPRSASRGSTEVSRRVMEGRGDDQRVTIELGAIRRRDLCRRRPGARLGRALRGLRQRGPGLLLSLAHLRRASGLRSLPRTARRLDSRGEGRRPVRRGDRMGPAHLGGARERSRPSSTEAWPSRRRPRRPRLLVPMRPGRGDERGSDRPRGGLRAGRSRHPVRGARRRRSASPTTPPTASRARSGRATVRGPSAWPAASTPGSSR